VGRETRRLFSRPRKPDILRVEKRVGRRPVGKAILADARVKWYALPIICEVALARNFALEGGGALINQAVHTVDLLLWMFGDVASVQATARPRWHSMEAKDTSSRFPFANERSAVLQATTSVYPGYRAGLKHWLRSNQSSSSRTACSLPTCVILRRVATRRGSDRNPSADSPLSAMHAGIKRCSGFPRRFAPTQATLRWTRGRRSLRVSHLRRCRPGRRFIGC